MKQRFANGGMILLAVRRDSRSDSIFRANARKSTEEVAALLYARSRGHGFSTEDIETCLPRMTKRGKA